MGWTVRADAQHFLRQRVGPAEQAFDVPLKFFEADQVSRVRLAESFVGVHFP